MVGRRVATTADARARTRRVDARRGSRASAVVHEALVDFAAGNPVVGRRVAGRARARPAGGRLRASRERIAAAVGGRALGVVTAPVPAQRCIVAPYVRVAAGAGGVLGRAGVVCGVLVTAVAARRSGTPDEEERADEQREDPPRSAVQRSGGVRRRPNRIGPVHSECLPEIVRRGFSDISSRGALRT